MIHQLTVHRWNMYKYLSAMYKRHVTLILALWIFCVWESLAITAVYVYERKVLPELIPHPNTTNWTNTTAILEAKLEMFNEFMYNQTNQTWDILSIHDSYKCFTGRQTCVQWWQ